MTIPTIAMDVDGTVADLISVWLSWYNRDYNDSLYPSNITDWAIHKFVKCGRDIYKYLEMPEIYEHVKPYHGALDFVNTIRKDYSIIWVTHATEGHAGRKKNWLREHGFLGLYDYYIETKDKSDIPADLLFDDYIVNVENFKGRLGRGLGYLIRRHWNENIQRYHSVHSWEEGLRIARSWLPIIQTSLMIQSEILFGAR